MRCGASEQPMSAPNRARQNLARDGVASPLRIVLVTNEPLYREGVEAAFCAAAGVALLAETGGNDALALAPSRGADMAIIDANTCRGTTELAHVLALTCPQLPVVVVAEAATVEDVAAAFEAGIRGFMLKNLEGDAFVRILTSIAQGARYLPPELAAGLLRQSAWRDGAQQGKRRPYRLTPREEQILGCVAQALTNKEVARELKISEKTVKHYMTVIMQKLQVRNRVEAVLKAKLVGERVASLGRRRMRG